VAKRVISPTITIPEATIFSVVHLDVMLMPIGLKGKRYIIAARDSLTQVSIGKALRHANSSTIAKFLWKKVICEYGMIGKVITDNGPEVQKAFEILVAKYHIPHAKISPYNSRANGVVERGHFIIREAITKACEGELYHWPEKVAHAFFADRVITRRSTGFSPYYLLHGVEPILPFDLTEATYLVEGFTKGMETEDLLAARIRQLELREDDLQRAVEAITRQRMSSKEQFERRFAHQLSKKEYEEGELVLVRNSRIEKELNRKTKDRYLGPYEVVKRTQGGSYALREMDGAPLARGVAAFRLLPYHPRGNLRLDEPRGDPDEDEAAEAENGDSAAENEQERAGTDRWGVEHGEVGSEESEDPSVEEALRPMTRSQTRPSAHL
jgi:hypothetical protein